jgi:hypothetical protein
VGVECLQAGCMMPTPTFLVNARGTNDVPDGGVWLVARRGRLDLIAASPGHGVCPVSGPPFPISDDPTRAAGEQTLIAPGVDWSNARHGSSTSGERFRRPTAKS